MSTQPVADTGATRTFEEQGYVIFRDVLDQDLIAEARDHLDWLMKKHPDLRPERLNYSLVPNDPFWVRLVSDDRLLDIAEQFIGPNIGLFASHYIAKPPKEGLPVLWHQDGSYWPLDPMEVVTLWLAVDPSVPENGCMRVIPGTHKLTLHENEDRPEIASVLGSGMDETKVDREHAVDIELQPGDVSVHHPNIIHGSEGNTSDMRRAGLTIRYIPTTTRITEDKGCPMVLRGEPVEGINEYLPFPKFKEGEHMPFRGCENWK
jgi:ectoine hydroxylase-related dioxygenase (phytanoyl-CoA dioxygenase family)